VNCLSGIAPPGASPAALRSTLVDNLRFAARELGRAGIKLLLEPINNVRDIPGFFVNTTGQALDLIREAGVPNIYVQADIYHMHVMNEDIAAVLDRDIERIAHLQIADDPGRHEPGTGTIDFASLFAQLDRLRYPGWIGCEYRPSTTTGESLAWLPRESSFS
jgi:hydroxypyruvate isomerase